MQRKKFFDENTKQWWNPQTGGANIPALNKLLKPFEIQFSDKIYSGSVRLKPAEEKTQDQMRFIYNSGSSLSVFPGEGLVIKVPLRDEVVQELKGVNVVTKEVPVLGLLQTESDGGRIVAFGDSSCMDNSFSKEDLCFWLVRLFLDFTLDGIVDQLFSDIGSDFLPAEHLPPPAYNPVSTFGQYSKVQGRVLPQCQMTSGPISIGSDESLESDEDLDSIIQPSLRLLPFFFPCNNIHSFIHSNCINRRLLLSALRSPYFTCGSQARNKGQRFIPDWVIFLNEGV